MKQIKTIDNLDASVNIPGSKSVTHRYLIMAALAEGRSWLGNGLWCDDTRYTASALERFGAQIRHSPEAIEVIGTGGDLNSPADPVYLENAGTSMRLLTAVACLGRGATVLVGNERLHTRPMEELLVALLPLGGVVESLQERGYPPVRIHGSGLKGGRTIVNASRSSQFVSAILLAAPYASQPVEITVQGLVSKPYVDVTLDGMSRFGARACWLDEEKLRVEAPGRYLGEVTMWRVTAHRPHTFGQLPPSPGEKYQRKTFSTRAVKGIWPFWTFYARWDVWLSGMTTG